MNLKAFEEYCRWLEAPGLEKGLEEELSAINGNEKEIEERFYKEPEFGTAGLRGILGAGTNRMNVCVIRRATLGLANYILTFDGGGQRGVAIAYDSRHKSREFAREAALTLCQKGIKVYLYDSLRPVSMLSYALRRLNCIAGIVITASHNPPQYNGYKVYWQDGGQVAPQAAESIYRHMQKADYFAPVLQTMEDAAEKGLLTLLSAEDDEPYYKDTLSLLQRKDAIKEYGKGINIVYTPLHGSGNIPVKTMLNRAGLTNVYVVEEQAQPNGDFPTVKTPNPEDPNTFALAEELARKVNGDIIIATDPDCDRMGIAVKDENGGYIPLSGNKTACIILYYMLCAMEERGVVSKDGFVAKSVVSTQLADAICKRFGVRTENTPTGFRFIARLIENSKRSGKGTFIFGFEESYGCLAGGFARDKDAVCAAMLISEAAAYYKAQGKGLLDVLDEIGRLCGYYDEAVKSYTLEGKVGMERINCAMTRVRKAPFESVADIRVKEYSDFSKTEDENQRMNMVRFTLDNGAWVCIRPSGTEPKLKLYIGAAAKNKSELAAKLNALVEDIGAKTEALLQDGTVD